MKKYKILIIDDDRKYATPLRDILEAPGFDHEVTIKTSPSKAIMEMNTTFEVVFIDFKFENEPNLTGAEVGRIIRKKYPLAILILITAYWDNIEYLSAYNKIGFDAVIPKDKSGQSNLELAKSIEDSIKDGQLNAFDRVKSCFSSNEVALIEGKLDMLERAIQYLIDNSDRKEKASFVDKYTIAATYGYLKTGKPIDKTIVQAIRTAKDARTKSTLTKEHKLGHSTTLDNDFQLRVTDATDVSYREEALKTRFLLKEYPQKWQLVRKHFEPVKKIKEHFYL